MIIVSAEYHRAAGLGNKLFPWARAKILASELHCPVKKNIWFSPRGGALIRGGVNYRTALAKTWLIGNFRRDPAEFGRFRYNLAYRNLPISYLDLLPKLSLDSKINAHYMFRWEKNHQFSDLWPHRKFIREQLLNIAVYNQSAYLAGFSKREFIALNVRTGNDFKHKSSNQNGYYFTELDWFVMALEKIRQKYGNLPAYIVSDGGPKQLGKLLELPDVSLVKTHTAIADLRILLNAKVLLGSGNSSFSAWASFLGGMDTFSSAETPFAHFNIVAPGSNQLIATL